MAAPYQYHVRYSGAIKRVVAVLQAGEVVSSPNFIGDAREIYSHASLLVEVGAVLPAGSTLVSSRTSD